MASCLMNLTCCFGYKRDENADHECEGMALSNANKEEQDAAGNNHREDDEERDSEASDQDAAEGDEEQESNMTEQDAADDEEGESKEMALSSPTEEEQDHLHNNQTVISAQPTGPKNTSSVRAWNKGNSFICPHNG
ncbi:acidic leucine-rich nuclear phosphoprotein 32 family member A-like [Dendropsophus ebraccatus]|uniref:acidic leucine-rich nuclear phosphoprotein 32 family member A-like n=1 Tax=Dendropsophus ebraccatus TaxID=150705 RepID=UPI003831A2FD